MTRTVICIVLLVLLLGSVTPGLAAPQAGVPASGAAAPPAQSGSASNSFGDPGDAYLEFSISGGDLTLREGTPSSYEGPWNGGLITFSGKMIVSRGEGTVSYVTMSANLADQSVQWPPAGESNEVSGRSVSQSFDFSFTVPPGYEGSAVTGGARLEVCGGVCGVLSVDFRIDLPTPVPANESAPTSALEVAPTPTTCPKLSADGKLVQILDRYYSRIPKGPTSSGKLTNTYDLLGYEGYSDFVCGGYQSQVLAFLDRLKFGTDPCEQVLLDDWDYGPIQSYWGYHQAVVLYPRGTNWLETGLVLDPWIEQTPKVYNIDEWAVLFSGGSFQGIGPSQVYTTQPQYPTVGGTYAPPGSSGLTKEEIAFVQALPPEKRAVLTKMSKHDQKRWLQAAMAGQGPLRRVAAHCPLNLYLTGPDGAQSGFPGGQVVADLADVAIRRLLLSDGTYWTELEYPENAGYTLVFEGTGSGQAYVLTADGATVEPLRRPVYQYAFPVQAGKTYQMATDRLGQPLVSGGEAVQPTVLQGLEPDWLGTLPGFAGIPEFAAEESGFVGIIDRRLLLGGVLLVILLIGGLVVVMKRSKRQSAHPAEDDWMDDLPSATAGAPIPAAAQRGGSGGHDEQSQWYLLTVEGPDGGKRYPLRTQSRLGRSSDNDVHLADPQASRQHATIQRLASDWIINDLGSSNGTFVGGARIAGPARLREGDTIRIGNTTLRLMMSAIAPEPRRVPASSPVPAPAVGGESFCPNCGHSLMAGARFCAICGASMDSAAVAAPPAYQPAPVPSAPTGDSIVGVISSLDRRKGLFGSEAFNLLLTPDRLIFARLTSDMLKAAVEQARQDAKAQGKGFFGQWGAQLGANSALAQRYYQMPVEAILREHPDNFQIPLQQIQKVQVKHGQYDEQQSDPDYLVIQAGSKMRFNLRGISAGEAKKALRQVLGDRVK